MRLSIIIAICLFTLTVKGQAQDNEKRPFQIDGQILERGEYRHGHIVPLQEEQDAAAFITQRVRLQASYKWENLTMYAAIQDVRTWGDTPQVKAEDNHISLHEGWASYQYKNWNFKFGRQELNYDNARFLGNLDWFMQGRAHDFALIKYEKGDHKLHFGGGYNQNGGTLPVAEQPYAVPNQYKTALMLRYEGILKGFNYSFLAWNESRKIPSDPDADYYDNLTLGLPTLRYTFGKNILSGFAYYQTGDDVTGRSLSAYDISAQYTRTFLNDENSGRKLRMLAGFEILSGTDNGVTDENNSYNPLYGTNHLFNGYMDVFYVANTHVNNVGLNDYYIKARYDFNKKFFSQLDYHYFQANAKVLKEGEKMDSALGSEIDLSLGYILIPSISIQAGYSQLFHTDTYSQVKGGNLQDTQNWAYLMLIFRPNMPQKFIGILF